MTLLEYVKQSYRDDKDEMRLVKLYCPSLFGLDDDCEGTDDVPNDLCEKCWAKDLKPKEVQ